MTSSPQHTFKHVSVFLLLIAAALFIYSDVGDYEFINFDDNTYVWNNRYVKNGLTSDAVHWAFSHSKTPDTWTYWHPLTSLSHILDCHFLGLDAGKHHLINLFFHILNAILLYLACYQMTGTFWKSAVVAALFAVHPLNVDSVAWVAERKNLLSTTFWMLTLLAYVHYARNPSVMRYLLVFTAMAAGLMAKPMLVTLPCALLLLDFWPLGRIRTPFIPLDGTGNQNFPPASFSRLILEKLPLLAIAIFSIMISIISLKYANQIISHDASPMLLRLENAIVSYIKYIGKIIWPHDMAIYYPFPEAIPAWQIMAATGMLAGISTAVIMLLKSLPALAIGWCWFLGTLTPVIGIIQGGLWPEIADRWTYVPAIGIFIMISWGGAAIISKLPRPRCIAAISSICIILPMMYIAKHQVSVWQNSITLFTHALSVTRENELSHYNLGEALSAKKEFDKAESHYLAALRLNPELAEAYNNMGNILAEKGQKARARKWYRDALNIDPELLEAHINLGKIYSEESLHPEALFHFNKALQLNPHRPEALLETGKAFARQKLWDEAIVYFRKAIELQPRSAAAFNSLGSTLAEKGELDNALAAFDKALTIDPDFREAHNNLGNALIRKGRLDEALYHYEKGITEKEINGITLKNRDALLSLLTPDQRVQVIFKTAVRFANEKNYNKAVALFQRITEIAPDKPIIYYNISCLYSIQNRMPEALEWLKKAADHGYENWEVLKNDPDMKNILNEPDVQKLMQNMQGRGSSPSTSKCR